MYNSFLIFDFGADEDAAQQARHKLDGWKQAFRLDKKLLYKFEREPGPDAHAPEQSAAEKPAPEKPAHKSGKAAKGKSKAAKEPAKAKPVANSPVLAEQPDDGAAPPSRDIKLLVRLYFSGHEKLSHQRWVDRIPREEPFSQAKPQTILQGDQQFADIDQKFESLD